MKYFICLSVLFLVGCASNSNPDTSWKKRCFEDAIGQRQCYDWVNTGKK